MGGGFAESDEQEMAQLFAATGELVLRLDGMPSALIFLHPKRQKKRNIVFDCCRECCKGVKFATVLFCGRVRICCFLFHNCHSVQIDASESCGKPSRQVMCSVFLESCGGGKHVAAGSAM